MALGNGRGQTQVAGAAAAASAPAPVRPRAAVSLVAVIALGLSLSACSSIKTGSIAGGSNTTARYSDHSIGALADQYQRNPSDPAIAIAFADALRADDRNAQAVEVLSNAVIHNPGQQDLAAAYGKALAANGNLKQALTVVRNAQRRDTPDWRLLSTEGGILDQMGEHKAARKLYAQALKIEPNAPTVLNNYGLSFALTGDLEQAESYLLQAAAAPGASQKVVDNLALIRRLKASG